MITMVSTQRSLPSFGTTNLMFCFGPVVGHQPSHASTIIASPEVSLSPKVVSS